VTDTASFYRGLPAKRAGPGILIARETEEILLVQPTYKAVKVTPPTAADVQDALNGAVAPEHLRKERWLAFEP
jgi:hypothetical protein